MSDWFFGVLLGATIGWSIRDFVGFRSYMNRMDELEAAYRKSFEEVFATAKELAEELASERAKNSLRLP